jgi:hypothetical protein
VQRVAILALVACGSSTAPDAMPSLDDLEIGCVDLPAPVGFATSADFAPAVPGTLADWRPDGRWFMTGARIAGESSVHFQQVGGQVVVDRDPSQVATLDDTELLHRVELTADDGSTRLVAIRISNLRPDGTARVERGSCADGKCRRCTARLVRATQHAGEGERLTLLGELSDPSWPAGVALNVRVAGTFAYLIRRTSLHIIDTSDPSRPVELGRYQRFGESFANDIKLVDAGARRFALIADTPVDVVEVTDPAAPRLVAQIAEESHTLFTETRDGATLAYFGNYDGTCPVYDVTDPTAPRKLGSYDAEASVVHDLSVDNGIAYLNAWEKGFLVVDFTDPATPALLGSWPVTPTRTSHSNWTTTVGGRRIALHGEEAYNAQLHVVDLEPASPTFMTPVAFYQTRPWISIHNIMAFGTKAYMTYYQDGVRVLDVSDPASPRQVGYFNSWDPDAERSSSSFFEGAIGIDVDLARKLVFVADLPRGLLILRDSTP